MSGAARKARKRAGEKFVRAPKVPTPLLMSLEFQRKSPKKQQRELEAHGFNPEEAKKLRLGARLMRLTGRSGSA